MYKTLGFKWLHEVFCPAFAFVTADSCEARKPQTFHTCARYRQAKGRNLLLKYESDN